MKNIKEISNDKICKPCKTFKLFKYNNTGLDFLQDSELSKRICLGQKWSTEEENLLIKEFNQGKSISELCEILHRSRGGINSRLKKLGLIK